MGAEKRYLGVDYGEKRVGLAYADSLGIAMPMPALVYHGKKELWARLKAIIELKGIQHCVVGLPLNMDDTEGPKAKAVREFAEVLSNCCHVAVSFSDERLTTHEVTLPRKKKTVQAEREVRERGVLDSRAAALILQDYLNEQQMSLGEALGGLE